MTILGLFMLLMFQDLKEENLDTITVEDRFSEAVSIFNSVQQTESEPLFKQIVADLELRPELVDEERYLMTESLKYLGWMTFPDETEDYFTKLIRFDPSYQMPARDLPQKIVTVFERLSQNLVGSVVVSCRDAETGAPLRGLLYVDGKEAGPIVDDTRFFLITGPRNLEIRRQNYEAFTAAVDVTSEMEGQVTGVLLRSSAEMHLVTYPRDVRIFANDVEVGLTSEDVGEEYFSRLRELGVPRKEAGSVVLNGLGTGKINLRFEKDCYQTFQAHKDIDSLKRITLKPVLMEPAQAYLSVTTADESLCLVFLGKQRVGFTPVERFAVCPGEYELRVRFNDGEYIKKLTLVDGQEVPILAEPQPSIAWYGLEDDKEGAPPGDMDAWINGLKTWNVHHVNPSDTSVVPISPFPLLFSGETMSKDNQAKLTQRLQADLYMAARVVRKVLIRTVEVAFWTPMSKKIQVKSFDFREFEKFQQLIQTFDEMPKLTKPWLGIQVASQRGIQGCSVLEVNAKGPLNGKLTQGELITKVDGNLLRNPAELIDRKPGVPVVLEVGDRDVEVVPTDTIAEVRFEKDQGAPQAMLAKFEKMAKYHPDPLIRESARFNQARFQFFLQDVEEAYDIFSTMSLTADYGISQGTLFYYQGLCFRRLKQISEATASFRSALQYPDATLFNAYGPKAAFWADAEMKNTSF